MRRRAVTLTAEFVSELKGASENSRFWSDYLKDLSASNSNDYSVHLAVLLEPYLRFILDGRKTVESRFSRNRIAPYKMVEPGDVILLKKSSARGISGLCIVRKVWFYQIVPDTWKDIRENFSDALCAIGPEFWEKRRSARYATLMRISDVQSLPFLEITKRDRRGWVTLCHRYRPTRDGYEGRLL